MAQDRKDRIAEKLIGATRHETIHLRVEQTQGRSQYLAADRALRITSLLDYTEKKGGQRRLDDAGVTEKGNKVHRTFFCDGKRYANLVYSEPSGVPRVAQIRREFANESSAHTVAIPFPLRAYHVGLRPLLEALPSAEFLPEATVVGRPCDVLHVGAESAERPEEYVVALDRETATPLRSTCFRSAEDYRTHIPFWVWEADAFDATPAHPSIENSTLRKHIITAGNGVGPEAVGQVNMTTQFRVLAHEVNAPIADATFWFTPQPGLIVIDALEPRRAARDGAAKAGPATATPEGVDAIRVEEPSAIPWSSLILALVGCALLVGAGWKSQRGRRPG